MKAGDLVSSRLVPGLVGVIVEIQENNMAIVSCGRKKLLTDLSNWEPYQPKSERSLEVE